MNKKIEMALSTITVSTLCLQPAMVMANSYIEQPTENQTVRVITSAKDFYEVFLCYKTYNENQEEVYTLFENVTEENADTLVSAKDFYNSLTPEFGEYYTIEGEGVTVQSNVLKEEIDALIEDLQENNEFFNFNSMCDQAKAIVEARETDETTSVETPVEQSETVETKSDVKVEEKDEVIDESKEDSKTEPEKEEVEEAKPEIVVPGKTEQTEESFGIMTLDLFSTDTLMMTPLMEQPLATVDETNTNGISQNVVKNTETKVADQVAPQKENVLQEMVSSPVSAKTAAQSAADEFIATYLTSSQGNVYAQANALNCKNIISGLQAWNALSDAEKNAVNKTLQNQIGKTYQTLLKEAQAISYSRSNQTTSTVYSYNYAVNTGAQKNIGLYAAICAVMAILIGVIIKKKHDTK